jgi:hypothetical protein
MRAIQGSELTFQTTSEVYRATVRPPPGVQVETAMTQGALEISG